MTRYPQRRHDLDGLRTLIILNLVPFHAAWMMVTVEEFSRIPRTAFSATLLTWYISFAGEWHMPLLFFAPVSFPFYILHILPLVLIGALVTRWRLDATAEFLAIVFLSFVATLGGCRIMEQSAFSRFVFGIKKRSNCSGYRL